MVNEILNIIENASGNFLGIGLAEEIFKDALLKNDNIKKCDLLSKISKKGKNIQGLKKRGNSIYIYRLRKKYHKNEFENIICNMDELKGFEKYFFKDMLFIGRKNIYLILDDRKVDDTLLKIKRYKVLYEVRSVSKGCILCLKKTRTPFFSSYLYFLIDTFSEYIDPFILFLEK